MENKGTEFILHLLAGTRGGCMPIGRVYCRYAAARHGQWEIVIRQLVESGEIEIVGTHVKLIR